MPGRYRQRDLMIYYDTPSHRSILDSMEGVQDQSYIINERNRLYPDQEAIELETWRNTLHDLYDFRNNRFSDVALLVRKDDRDQVISVLDDLASGRDISFFQEYVTPGQDNDVTRFYLRLAGRMQSSEIHPHLRNLGLGPNLVLERDLIRGRYVHACDRRRCPLARGGNEPRRVDVLATYTGHY